MRHLRFTRMIDKYAIESLLADLRRVDAPRAVYVSSPGGEFEFFSSLGPAIERQGITTLSGDIRSAAVILYLLGHSRKALPDSTFFFHEVRTLVMDQMVSIAEVEEVEEYERWMSTRERDRYEQWKSEMRSAQTWFLHFLTTKTGIPTGVFLNLMQAEATLTAREAAQYGIVHEIVSEEVLLP